MMSSTKDKCIIEKPKNERRKNPKTDPSIIPTIPPIVVIINISASGIRLICLKVPPRDWKTAKSFILDTASKEARTLAEIMDARTENNVKYVRYESMMRMIDPLNICVASSTCKCRTEDIRKILIPAATSNECIMI